MICCSKEKLEQKLELELTLEQKLELTLELEQKLENVFWETFSGKRFPENVSWKTFFWKTFLVTKRVAMRAFGAFPVRIAVIFHADADFEVKSDVGNYF